MFEIAIMSSHELCIHTGVVKGGGGGGQNKLILQHAVAGSKVSFWS